MASMFRIDKGGLSATVWYGYEICICTLHFTSIASAVQSYVNVSQAFKSHSRTSCMFNLRLFPVSGVSDRSALEGDSRTRRVESSLAGSANWWVRGEARGGAGAVRIGGSCNPSRRCGRFESWIEFALETGCCGYGEAYEGGWEGGWIVGKYPCSGPAVGE
jgi:hypothetical protein